MCVSSYVPLFIERGELMVEFDNIKISLSNYDEPLLEMGNHFDLANKRDRVEELEHTMEEAGILG